MVKKRQESAAQIDRSYIISGKMRHSVELIKVFDYSADDRESETTLHKNGPFSTPLKVCEISKISKKA